MIKQPFKWTRIHVLGAALTVAVVAVIVLSAVLAVVVENRGFDGTVTTTEGPYPTTSTSAPPVTTTAPPPVPDSIQIDWAYECVDGKCKRTFSGSNQTEMYTLPVCHLKCLETATLWPMPSNLISLDRELRPIHLDGIYMNLLVTNSPYWEESLARFRRILESKIPPTSSAVTTENRLEILIFVIDESMENVHSTNESYQIAIEGNFGVVAAQTFYGARHGLETISQLFVFDELSQQFMHPVLVNIQDEPVYKHRGILLDTARRYYSLDSIKRTIDVMAMTKLNVFHWHITDSNSFAMLLPSHPDLVAAGAYSAYKIYTPEMIRDVVDYAQARGVRVLPEFDAPAHVGEGWQFTNLTACYNAQPWQLYCAGPPCGQLDPTNAALYSVLERIYGDMEAAFGSEFLHMGGDEVVNACWHLSDSIREWMEARGWQTNDAGYLQLWSYFQDNALEAWKKVHGDDAKVILWTSSLTEEDVVEDLLSNTEYIIQVWTTGSGSDSHVPHLLEKGYDLIMSNYDAFYFDCGFGSYVGTGNNWCSPYKPWTAVYDNNLRAIAGDRSGQILGGEACLWSSLSDEATLDSRLWPRASAMGERLWSEPETNFREAEARILFHREFLVQYGIKAESIQPEWCMQYEGECPLN